MCKSNTLTKRLSRLINKKVITPIARELNVIQRQSKIDITQLIWAMI
jgi:hypothetical protein